MQSQAQPIPFIMINQKIEQGTTKCQFQLHQKAIQVFKSIRDKKIAIATVAGPQRSGKSFLSNMLLKRMRGFAVGPSTMPCTKGLWIWGEPVKISEDTMLIIMDTQGLNSVRHIDEKAIENMAYVLRISENIKIKSEDNSQQELSKCFPYFYWVLRDFSLDLKGMSQNQYLESALKPHNNNQNDPKNQTRNKIRKLFTFRSCQCFPRPINQQDKLAHIQQQDFQNLRQVFKDKVNQFVHKFYQTLPVKQFNGKTMTAEIYLNLTREYISAINTGKIPEVLSSLQRVIQSQAKKLTDQLAKYYRQQMAKIFNREPVDETILQRSNISLIKDIQRQIDNRLKQWRDFGQADNYKKRLLKFIQKSFIQIKKQNMNLCTKQCQQQFNIFTKQLFVLPQMKFPQLISQNYFKSKVNDLIEKIQPYYKKCKQPRKYVYFMEKFPKQVFQFCQLFMARAKGIFNKQYEILKSSSRNYEEDTKSLQRRMKEQQNLLIQKQNEVESAYSKIQDLQRELKKYIQIRQFQKKTQNMGKGQIKKKLQEQVQHSIDLQNKNKQLVERLQKKINEVKNLQNLLKQKEQKSISTAQSQLNQTPGQVINILQTLKNKVSVMQDYYDSHIKEQSVQQTLLRQIQQLRVQKQVQIQKAKQKFNQKLTQMRTKYNKQKAQYEKNMDMLNTYLDDIKQRNIKLQKIINDRSNNNNAAQRKNLQQSIRLKQNNINSLKAINLQKDKKITDLQLKLARLNSQMANLQSYKQTFPYILGQSLAWIQGKNNQLKHSLKTLDSEDEARIKRVFKQANLSPF